MCASSIPRICWLPAAGNSGPGARFAPWFVILSEARNLLFHMRIGILAVQGDYEAFHARMLERLGADYIFVRTPRRKLRRATS